jgi:5-hydroxyisourate hydrolase
MSPITTHILDISKGRPAAGVSVSLEQERAGSWQLVGSGSTDADGRVRTLLPDGARLEPGQYRLSFETGEYFARDRIKTFYTSVVVSFTLEKPDEHYHVPLLLSPFGYSTYRGS